jgi:hypothetical protein
VSATALSLAAQAALAVASKAMKNAFRFADAASQAGAWAMVEKQLQLAMTAFLEHLKRQQAEQQVAFSNLLAEAKEKGVQAFDSEGLLKMLEGCKEEAEVLQQVQVRFKPRPLDAIYRDGRQEAILQDCHRLGKSKQLG